MEVVGKTEDGKIVISEAFKAFDTHGVPLEILLDIIKDNNFQIDFMDFVETARKAGWKDKTIFNRLIPAVADVYGKEYTEAVIQRLEIFCKLYAL